MATLRTVQFDDILEFEVEDVDLSGVHFTDEEFDGALSVRNISGDQVTGTLELQSDTESTIGLDQDPIRSIEFEIDLEPGEVHREPFGGVGMVGGSGTGLIVSVRSPEVVHSDGQNIVIEPSVNLLPLANVVFWDREFYRANYVWPRRAQYLSVVFALLSALLAGTIVWISII
jgi:hypothetical protein